MIKEEKIRKEILRLYFDSMYDIEQIYRHYRKLYNMSEIRQVIFDKLNNK